MKSLRVERFLELKEKKQKHDDRFLFFKKEKRRQKKEENDGRLKSLPVFVAFNSPMPSCLKKNKTPPKKQRAPRDASCLRLTI